MRKNVASQVIGAQMVSATDGSAFTGSVTVSVTVDGGTQATGSVGSGACTHEGGGFHTYAPAQAETNGNHVAFTFTGTGAIPVTIQVYPVGFDETAAQVPANVTHFGGSAGTFASGRPEVNASHAAGTAWNSGAIGASTLAADTLTAAKIATDAGTEIAAAVMSARALHSGTAQAGAAGTITLASGANSTNDYYANTVVQIRSGTGAGQSRFITGYVGSTRVATVDVNWVTNPDNTSVYDILPGVSSEASGTLDANVVEWMGSAPNSLTSGRVDVTVGAMQANVLTASALNADAVDEILDEQIGDSTITVRQALRGFVAALLGKVGGAGTSTETFRNAADTSNVIVATVDASGNRTAITLNL